jgi:TolB-like protein/DNA-binding SARP family transcriptional activator/Flp pilus assembly protein TadD
MPSLQLTLFGGFRACLASGEEVVFARRKAMFLLAYLALQPDASQTRDKLTGLLWGDRGEAQARGSLRQTLTGLRKTLRSAVPPPLLIDGDRLGLDPQVVEADVRVFEALSGSDAVDDLQRAVELYRGPFLDGIALRSADCEQWLLRERERLRERLLGILDRLLARHLQEGALDDASATVERILAHDPLREDGHRMLMQLQVRQGRRNLALRQYRLCHELLSRELGVQPEAETVRLYEEIQSERASAAHADGRPDRIPGGEARESSVRRPPAGIAEPAPRAAIDRPAIAVLPFTNIGDDPEQEYFADGLTEDIITDLSQVSGLFVVARHTVFTFKAKPVRVEDVVRELNVRYVLDGSVRKAGGRVRITAQLIDGQTGGHVWAHRYDRSLDDIIAVQDEISKSIVDVLKVRLLPAELETITSRATSSAPAYEYYHIGRSFYLRGIDRRSLTIARALFAKAIELDPCYARAYAGAAICDSYLTMSDTSASFEGTLAKIARALDLEPNLAEAYAVKGMVMFAAGCYSEATAEFERAMRLNPDLFEAHFFHARNCRVQGRPGEAVVLYARAAELRPNDFRSMGLLAELHRALGRREDFLSAARRCLERLSTELKAHPDNADAWAFGSAILAQLGQMDRADDWATRALVIGPDDYLVRYNVARTYALLGRIEAGLDQLEQAFEALPEFRRRLAAWMQRDEEIGPLRGDPRFRALERRLATGSRPPPT